MRLVYVDEAGISSKEPVLTVAAVTVDADKKLVAVERQLDKLVTKWIPEDQREDFVFHAMELFNGTHKGSGKPFERDHPDWPLSKRYEIADDLAKVFVKFKLPFFPSHMIKADFPKYAAAKAHFATLQQRERDLLMHVITFMGCAIGVEHWMRDHAKDEVCLMVVEDNDQVRSRIRDAQNQHQNPGIAKLLTAEQRLHFPLRKIKEDPLFQKKKKSSVLQLADFLAYTSKRFAAGDALYERWMRPIWPFISHAGEKFFPDLERQT